MIDAANFCTEAYRLPSRLHRPVTVNARSGRRKHSRDEMLEILRQSQMPKRGVSNHAQRRITDRTLLIYGELKFGTDEVTGYVRQRLRDVGADSRVDVLLSSKGGSLGVAFEVYSLLQNHRGLVTTRVIDEASSAGSVLAMGGDRVVMRTGTFMMIHEAGRPVDSEGMSRGEIRENIQFANDQMVNVYKLKTGLQEAKLRRMMARETTLNERQCLSLGFCDAIESGR